MPIERHLAGSIVTRVKSLERHLAGIIAATRAMSFLPQMGYGNFRVLSLLKLFFYSYIGNVITICFISATFLYSRFADNST